MKKYFRTQTMVFDKETGEAVLKARNVVTRMRYEAVKCKYCGRADHVVLYGKYRGVQRYFCKKCRRKFAGTSSIPGMRTPPEHISSALSMFYEGMSLGAIRRHLRQTYNIYPSDSTIYNWIIKYTKKAVSAARDYRVKAGSVWVADETVLKIGGENHWFWDVIDERNRFLLASHISTTRSTRDAETLMSRASKNATKAPEIIVTDKLAAYLDGIERVFGADTRHVLSKGFRVQPNINLVERMHGTIKSRTKVMRGMQNKQTAKLITDGWLTHYNFFRPHEALKGKTPAQKAGIEFPYKNWADVVNSNKKEEI